MKSTAHRATWLLGFVTYPLLSPDGKETIIEHDELVLGGGDEGQIMDLAVKLAIVARTLGDMKARSARSARSPGVKPNEATRILLANAKSVVTSPREFTNLKGQIAKVIVDDFNLKFEDKRPKRLVDFQQVRRAEADDDRVRVAHRRSAWKEQQQMNRSRAIKGWMTHFRQF